MLDDANRPLDGMMKMLFTRRRRRRYSIGYGVMVMIMRELVD